MASAIVGDRFVRERDDVWRDLVTGDQVAVAVRDLPVNWEERSQTLAEQRASGLGGIIDYGRLGLARWFEVRGPSGCKVTIEEARNASRAAEDVLAAVSGAEAAGVRFVRPAVDILNGRAAASVIGPQVRALGFVCLRASVEIPRECRAELDHRHLVVVLFDARERQSAAAWIRRLSAISTRGHVVVDLSEGPSNWRDGAEVAVRERTPSSWIGSVNSHSPTHATVRCVRAAAHAERGRVRDAERWYQAAIASGRRHDSESVQAEACRALVDLHVRRDAWDRAVATARDVLKTLRDHSARSLVSAVLSSVFVARGETARAETVLASAAAEARVHGAPLSAMLRLGHAELRFWQGRFEEAADWLSELPPSTNVLALEGLVSWAVGDRTRLTRVQSKLDLLGESVSSCRFWKIALEVLDVSLNTDTDGIAFPTAGFERSLGSVGRPSLARLGRAMAAEALLSRGRRAEALQALGPASLWRAAPARDALVRAQIEAGASWKARQLVNARIDRTGLLGIRRWGAGGGSMHLIHAVPAVLEVVQDAEDELAALIAVCRWAQRECGAEAVAFLGADDRRLIAGDGWPVGERFTTSSQIRTLPVVADEARCTVSVPVRYAAAEIGMLVLRGPRERAGTLEEAARILSALCAPALRARLDRIRLTEQGQSLTPEILGRSPAIRALKETVARAAGAPFTVLIEGESGTGKELVARAIHRLSARRDHRFAAFNCAAISDELVEAELFGHARGAFTGAIAPRAGLFEDAHRGSLFLDEVSELSARAQAKLLRVLQEKEVRRVGENAARPVDVRIIAATNRPLSDVVRRGLFREDLRFRLAVVCIRLPPLRDRIEDLPLLANGWWRSLTCEAGKRAVLGPDAIVQLCRHGWPGNVRELQNVMSALVVLAPVRGRVGARLVQQVIDVPAGDEPVIPLEHVRTRSERRAVTRALARHSGRRAPAARDLGLTRQGLAKAIKRLGLERTRDTAGVA